MSTIFTWMTVPQLSSQGVRRYRTQCRQSGNRSIAGLLGQERERLEAESEAALDPSSRRQRVSPHIKRISNVQKRCGEGQVSVKENTVNNSIRVDKIFICYSEQRSRKSMFAE